MSEISVKEQKALQKKREKLEDAVLREQKLGISRQEQERYRAEDTPQAQYQARLQARLQAREQGLFARLPVKILVANFLIWTLIPTFLAPFVGATVLQTLLIFGLALAFWGGVFLMDWLRWRYYWWFLAIQWSLLTLVWFLLASAIMLGLIGAGAGYFWSRWF